jgi:hypothetical protein
MIGSSVFSSVISFLVTFGPMLRSKGSDNLNHERDKTLAINDAIPDLIRDTNRHVIQAGSEYLMAFETVRVELTGEAGFAGNEISPITAARHRYKSKGPIR